MEILLIGSSGGVAARLIPTLRSCIPELRITGLDLKDKDQSDLDAFVQCDLLALVANTDQPQTAVTDAFSRADAIILLAAAVHNPKLSEEAYTRLNADVPQKLLHLYQAARIKQPRHVVFFSTIAVYGQNSAQADEESTPHPETPYAVSKLEGEKRLLAEAAPANDTRLTILRPATVISRDDRGNLPKLVHFAARKRVLFTVKRGINKTFVDVEDLGRIVCAVLTHDGAQSRIYNAAGPPVDLREILELVATVSRPFVRLPMPHGVLRKLSPTMAQSVSVSGTKAETELGITCTAFRDAFLREFSQ